MVVKIVTDSSADIPVDIARELDITVIPLYIRFGQETYRDGIDIDADRFYEKLKHSHSLPSTSVPSPGDFAETYGRLATKTDSILSIHLSPRYSGVLNVARVAREYAPEGCTVELVDSGSVSMGCGLVVMAAAREAARGASLEQVKETVDKSIRRTHIIGMISDIHYLLGGRRLMLPGWHLLLGRLGTICRFRLVGEIYEAGRVRGRGMYFFQNKALVKLERCVTGFSSVAEIAVLYAIEPAWAQSIAGRLKERFPAAPLHVSRLSGATGVHGGPQAMAIAFIEKNIY